MSEKEIAQFRAFLSHPLGEERPSEALRFFDLGKEHGAWETEIDKETFLERANLNMNEGAFDKECSKLKNALIRYASAWMMLDQDFQRGPNAIQYFGQRDLDLENLQIITREEIRYLDSVEPDASYFLSRMRMNLILAVKMTSRRTKPEQRNFESLHSDLDAAFAIMKLRYLCATTNQQAIYRSPIGLESDQHFVRIFSQSYPTLPLLAKLYFHVFHILKEEEGEFHIHQFASLIQEWDQQFKKVEDDRVKKKSQVRRKDLISQELNSYVRNYYVRRLNNADDPNALPILDQLYNDALQNGWILHKGKLEPDNFTNIVSIRCRMKKVKEAKQIFKQFKGALTDDMDGNVLEFEDVHILFYEKDYKNVLRRLEILRDATGSFRENESYGLRIRCLMLKALFEYMLLEPRDEPRDLHEDLTSLLRAFQLYITRQGVAMQKQMRYENFRKNVSRLWRVRFQTPLNEIRGEAKELLRDLRSSSNLPDKDWFLQQAEDLAR